MYDMGGIGALRTISQITIPSWSALRGTCPAILIYGRTSTSRAYDTVKYRSILVYYTSILWWDRDDCMIITLLLCWERVFDGERMTHDLPDPSISVYIYIIIVIILYITVYIWVFCSKKRMIIASRGRGKKRREKWVKLVFRAVKRGKLLFQEWREHVVYAEDLKKEFKIFRLLLFLLFFSFLAGHLRAVTTSIEDDNNIQYK